MGKLIVIEGLDGCGKSTQTGLLPQSLEQTLGASVKRIKLPDYDDPSSTLVKMYLAGEFSDSADGLSPYAASVFYAADRIASFKRHWQKDYGEGTVIVADRYTTSNAIYQLSKLDRSQWDGFLDWLWDLEYGKLGLPKPDAVLFLDVPPEDRQKMLEKRYGGDLSQKDIHERDDAYLLRCREAAAYAAERDGWYTVTCTDGAGNMRSVESIQNELVGIVAACVREDKS